MSFKKIGKLQMWIIIDLIAVFYLCLSLACVFCLHRGLREIQICDTIRSTVPPDWTPFLRPSSKYLPSLPLMYLRAFFIAPLSVIVFCSIFALLGLVGTVLGHSPMSLYPRLAPVLNVLMNVKLEIRGKPAKVPIYVCNHVAVFDTHFIALAQFSITALAKREVGNLPFVGRVARLIGCIFVDRSSAADRQAAQTAIDHYARDYSPHKPTLLIYPEGTTGNHLQLLPFKTGAFQTAEFQPVRIEYPNPHFSFSIASNQLVPWTFCFALGGGVVRLSFLDVQHPLPHETPDATAQRTRLLIAGERFPLAESGTYRAHNDLTKYVSNLRVRGNTIPPDNLLGRPHTTFKQ